MVLFHHSHSDSSLWEFHRFDSGVILYFVFPFQASIPCEHILELSLYLIQSPCRLTGVSCENNTISGKYVLILYFMSFMASLAFLPSRGVLQSSSTTSNTSLYNFWFLGFLTLSTWTCCTSLALYPCVQSVSGFSMCTGITLHVAPQSN